jgi:hypothetical protein
MEGKPLKTGSSALATGIDNVVAIEKIITAIAVLRILFLTNLGVTMCERMHLLSPILLIFRGNLAGLLGEVALRN